MDDYKYRDQNTAMTVAGRPGVMSGTLVTKEDVKAQRKEQRSAWAQMMLFFVEVIMATAAASWEIITFQADNVEAFQTQKRNAVKTMVECIKGLYQLNKFFNKCLRLHQSFGRYEELIGAFDGAEKAMADVQMERDYQEMLQILDEMRRSHNEQEFLGRVSKLQTDLEEMANSSLSKSRTLRLWAERNEAQAKLAQIRAEQYGEYMKRQTAKKEVVELAAKYSAAESKAQDLRRLVQSKQSRCNHLTRQKGRQLKDVVAEAKQQRQNSAAKGVAMERQKQDLRDEMARQLDQCRDNYNAILAGLEQQQSSAQAKLTGLNDDISERSSSTVFGFSTGSSKITQTFEKQRADIQKSIDANTNRRKAVSDEASVFQDSIRTHYTAMLKAVEDEFGFMNSVGVANTEQVKRAMEIRGEDLSKQIESLNSEIVVDQKELTESAAQAAEIKKGWEGATSLYRERAAETFDKRIRQLQEQEGQHIGMEKKVEEQLIGVARDIGMSTITLASIASVVRVTGQLEYVKKISTEMVNRYGSFQQNIDSMAETFKSGHARLADSHATPAIGIQQEVRVVGVTRDELSDWIGSLGVSKDPSKKTNYQRISEAFLAKDVDGANWDEWTKQGADSAMQSVKDVIGEDMDGVRYDFELKKVVQGVDRLINHVRTSRDKNAGGGSVVKAMRAQQGKEQMHESMAPLGAFREWGSFNMPMLEVSAPDEVDLRAIGQSNANEILNAQGEMQRQMKKEIEGSRQVPRIT